MAGESLSLETWAILMAGGAAVYLLAALAEWVMERRRGKNRKNIAC